MSLALNVTFVGLFVVFSSLILLSLVIFIFGKVVVLRKSKTEGNMVDNIEETSTLENSRGNKTDAHSDAVSDDELVAVLTAAVMACLKPGTRSDISVKSFRRIPQDSPVWNVTGRMEHIAGKL